MTELSWDLFRVKNSDYTKSFEALCKNLFARKIKVNISELIEYHNHKGIEVEPVLYKNKLISFQSKFSDADKVLWLDFEESLEKTIEELKTGYAGLKEIIHYSNGKAAKTNKIRDRIEKKAKKNGLKIIWIYGKQILDLVEEINNSDLRKKYYGGGKNLEISLSNIDSIPPKNLSALKYQSQLTSFVGRDSEFAELEKFMDSPEKIQWIVIEGQGGVGKSRLALELAKKYIKKNWHCGFYTEANEHGFNSWNPEKPHLIICDYVLGREKDITSKINKAIELESLNELSFSVRYVLIERTGGNIVKKLTSAQTIGVKIENCLNKPSTLALNEVGIEDIKLMLDEVSRFFELKKNEVIKIVDKVTNSDYSNKFIYGALLCLNQYYKNIDDFDTFDELVRDLVKRERKDWFKNAKFKKEHEHYIVLSSMLGGLSLRSNDELLPQSFNKQKRDTFLNKYSLIVGQKSNDFLAPLSHDLINELYALDFLNEREKFNEAIKSALNYENGISLLSFFTRAANDYENHETLSYLLSQFTSEESGFFIWLFILANTIDKINEDLEIKIRLLNNINRGISNSNKRNDYLPILENIFIRLLNQSSNSNMLNKYIGEYSILKEFKDSSKSRFVSEKPGVTENETNIAQAPITSKLKPLQFCKDIIAEFRGNNKEIQSNLVCIQLFEVYHHYAIHELSSKTANLNNISKLVSEINNVFTNGWEPGLARLFRDIVASTWQWNYARKEPQMTSEITLKTLMLLENRKVDTGLAGCYSAASTVIATTLHKYNFKKDILERFKTSFKQYKEQEYLSTQFIGISVSLMYHFESQLDFNYGFEVLKRAQFLTDKFPSKENGLNLSLAIGQLLSYNGDYINKQQKSYLVKNCISIAKKYGSQNIDVILRIVQRLNTEYSNLIRQKSNNSEGLFKKILSLVMHFKSSKFEKKLHLGQLLQDYFNHSLENNNLKDLKSLADIICELNTISYVDLNHMWNQLQSLFFGKYQTAKNNSSSIEIYKKTAEYWLEKKCAQPMDSLLSHIVSD